MNIDPQIERLRESLPGGLAERMSVTKIKCYLFISGALLAAALYVVFLIIPLMSRMAETNERAEETRSRTLLDQKRIERYDEFLKKRQELRDQWADLTRGLPQARELPQFLEELSNVARNSQVKIISIRPIPDRGEQADEDPASQYYRPIPIEITAKSGFHQLGVFVSELEAGERVITIEKLSIRHDRLSPRLHDVHLVIKTYAAVGGEDES